MHQNHYNASFTDYRATLCVSAVFAVVQCPPVCPSVCPSRWWVLYPDGWRYRQTSFSVR